MYKKLEDYCKARLSEEYKPKCKKVTNKSFADFLKMVSDDISELRKNDHSSTCNVYENVEDDFTIYAEELAYIFDKSLTVVLDEKRTDEEKLASVEKIRYVAFCGLCSARLLLGFHLLCDSYSPDGRDLGRILLLWACWDMENGGVDVSWVNEILSLSFDLHPAPSMAINEDEIFKYAKFLCLNDDYQWISYDPIGAYVDGWNAIGSIRICCDWFEKPIEVFCKDDRVDVYTIPCLPTWYVLKCIGDKVGTEKMNDLAGVRLFDDEKEENHLPSVFL